MHVLSRVNICMLRGSGRKPYQLDQVCAFSVGQEVAGKKRSRRNAERHSVALPRHQAACMRFCEPTTLKH